MACINSTFTGKVQNYHHHGPSKLQNAIKEIQSIKKNSSSKKNFIKLRRKIHLIKEKLTKADYSLCFINSVINEFQKGKDHEDESAIISPDLFGISKPLISIKIPYCEFNEIKSKHFLKKFQIH